MHIHLWAPGALDPRGGIATYSRHLAKAIAEIVGPSCLELHTQHDLPKRHPTELPGVAHFGSGNIPVRLRSFAFALRTILGALRRKPDLIVVTHLQYGRMARWVCSVVDIPYWIVAHGVEAWESTNPALEDRRVRAAISESSRVLPVSNFTKDILLKEQELSPDRVHVLYNTFEPADFALGEKPSYLLDRYGLSREQPIILTVSRLIKSGQREGGNFKGYDPVIHALPSIVAAHPNAHYVLVGKGDDRERLEEVIRSLNLTEHVTLTGFVPDNELADHYRLCDVFALPSKREGFGIVFLEAMACGKPCLGGNKDAARDALQHGALGVLVDPDDTFAIADAIAGMLSGLGLNDVMRDPEELRKRVVEAFGFDSFVSNVKRQLGSALPVRNS